MKKVSFVFILLIGLGFISYAQTVTIGSQVWMTKNIDVAKFRNGDSIPEAKTVEEWVKAGEKKQPAWCYYDNNPANATKYGKLYNWHAVNDPRGIAPVGYHLPSDEEWTVLTDYLGGEEKAGAKMKSKTDWIEGSNDTNSSGFSGLPAGNRFDDGSFGYVGEYGNWWSSSEVDTDDAVIRGLYYKDGTVGQYSLSKKWGLSVRCLKD